LFIKTVALVERNIMPQDILLVDANAVAKSRPQDLMMLAAEIEKVIKSNSIWFLIFS